MRITALELLLRLVAAAVLCGLIGLERETRDQVAGLRTHMLVGVGSALFTLVSAYGFEAFALTGSGATLRPDPTRVAAQIVSGIGFLGAGAIIRQGFNVRGVTTAAALWISAAVGMAVGAGYYLGAGATTVIVLSALVVFGHLSSLLLPRIQSDYVVLELKLSDPARVSEIFDLLARRGVRVTGMVTEHEEGVDNVKFELRVPAGVSFPALLDEVLALDPVTGAATSGVGSVTSSA